MEKLTFYIHPSTSFAKAQALVLAHLDEFSEQGCYESTLPKLFYPQGDFTEADELRPVGGFIAGIWSEPHDKWINETAIYLVRHPWAPKGKIVGGYGLKMPRNRKKNFKKGN